MLDRQLIANRRERSSATLVTVSDVHQCPYCELRFVSRNELNDHVAVDHPQPVDDDIPVAPPHPASTN
jgi:hypothetical protein